MSQVEGNKLSRRGYVTALNGKPLTMWLNGLQLGEARKLFRYRAASRGAAPTTGEIDDALWVALETGELADPFQPTEGRTQ